MLTRRHRSYGIKTPRFQLSANCPVAIHEPSVFSAVDPHAVNGHGFSFDDSAPIKAVGEYLERYVAFRACTPTHSARLAEMGISILEQQAFLEAASQTCPDPRMLEGVSERHFNLVEVKRLADSSRCLYPVSLVSLHSDSDQLESQLIPIRDSSGNSIHTCRKAAFNGAILEFIERQCATAMWVSRRCNQTEVLSPQHFGTNKKAHLVLAQMQKIGSIQVHDISFLKGCSVKFIEFKSHDPYSLVHFACGSSASFDSKQALLKAFIETWQTSVLLTQMPFFENKDYGSDALKKNAQDANNPNFSLGLSANPITLGDSRECNIKKLEPHLLAISENIYVYEKSVWVSGTQLWFTRIFSPDFFIHMNPGKGNNNNNKWISNFCDDASKRLLPLPFS